MPSVVQTLSQRGSSMKRLTLCLIAFAFVATFATAQSQRLGSLAEIEKSAPTSSSRSIVGMIDNMRKDTPLYKAHSSMLKNNMMVFNTKKDNVLVILGFKRKRHGHPKFTKPTTTCSATPSPVALRR